MAQQPAARAVVAVRDAPEVGPEHIPNPIVAGQTFVDERIVRAQQIENAAVLAEDAFKKELRFTLEVLRQAQIEIREQSRARSLGLHVAQIQPLCGEVARQRLRASVSQHPVHLLFEHRRILEFPTDGHV